jgi:hypothetical protein
VKGDYRMVRNIVGLGLLMAGFLLGIAQGGAQVEIDPALVPKSFMSGKDWRGLSKGEQQAYAVGVVDGLDLASAYEKQGTNLAWINPCATGMSSDQVRAMLLAEIDANPGEWNLLTVHQSMYRALRKACRQSPGKSR